MPRYSLGGGGGTAAVTALNNATANELVTVGSTTTELDAETALTFDGSDMKLLEAVNDGNPSISIGGADAERLVIQAKFDSGAQTLESVEFATAAASGTADRGKMVFDVDGTDIMTIDDGGVNIGTGSLETATIDYTDGDLSMTIADGGGVTFAQNVAVADSKFIEFESAAGTPTTDNTVQGVVIEFLAVEAITQFDAVYVSTTTGRVGRADANDAAKMPVIGIAIEAQGSAGSSVRVLTHGVYRDDGGFGGNMTVGVDLYAPETPGTLTTTRPSDNGDFIQVIGVAIGVRSAFVNPSLDIIEHA